VSDLSDYTIVVDPKSRFQDKYAAEILRKYLNKICGKIIRLEETVDDIDPHTHRKLRKCIYVGPGDHLGHFSEVPEFGFEELLILKQDDRILLHGGGKRGALYAVSAFLEKFIGCRFFSDDLEYTPKSLPELPEAIHFSDNPAFTARDATGWYTVSGEWAVKNRVNGHFANVTSAQGGKMGYFPFCHSFDKLVPPDKYFFSHPEYFSLINGQRNPRQLCLANPELQEVVVRQVLEWIGDYPDRDIFSVSENDGGGVCECAECVRMNGNEKAQSENAFGIHKSQCGTYFRFINIVAKEVAKHYPDKYIETLAYNYAPEAPREIELDPNVIVRVCRVDTNEKMFLDESLPAWLKVSNNIHIWHYAHSYNCFQLYPILESASRYCRIYRDMGVKGLFFETEGYKSAGIESLWLKNYVLANLLWDPDKAYLPLVEDYFNHAYGAAASEMLECFNQLYLLLERHGEVNPNDDTCGFTRKLLPLCRISLQQAGKKRLSAASRKNVEEVSIPFEYVSLFENAKTVIDQDYATAMVPGSGRQATRKFLSLLKKHKIDYVKAGGDGVKTEALRKALEPKKIIRLSNKHIEAVILPESGGRIIQFFDKHSGTNLLPDTDAATSLSFNGVGLDHGAGSFFQSIGYDIPFRVVSKIREKTLLAADLANGLRFRKTVSVSGNKLSIECDFENRSQHNVLCSHFLHNRFSFDPAGSFQGKDRAPALLGSYGEEGIDLLLEGYSDICINLPNTGVSLALEYAPETTRIFLWGNGKNGLFTLSLSGSDEELPPGGHYKVKYGLIVNQIVD
jgi:hypothetical protein